MAKEKQKIYITTSIAYTNSKPHIGYCLELLQADVIARNFRQLGRDVWFLTGTDEHGSKIANKAKELKKEPKQFVDEISAKFQELKPLLNLSCDDFIRTSDQKRHWPTVKQVWLALKENGAIYKKKYKGLYCVGCEAFVTEKDLVEGECPNHKKAPEVIEEENYFFKLSKYQEELRDILEENKIKIIPEAKKNEMLSFIKEGLEDVSCSREKSKLEWGILVPDDENQVIYVWFEALINYLSALGYLTDKDEKFKSYWPPSVQCIGKDIIRFHALLWPAMLFGLGLELPKKLLIHGYITSNGEKMSKSIGNVIDPFELIGKYTEQIGDKKAAIDALRYFLLREVSSTEDGDFTFKRFEERYNSDLANGIGNLLARTVTLAGKLKVKSLPAVRQGSKLQVAVKSEKLREKIEETKQKVALALEDFKFNEALSSIWELISFCDRYVNETKPWEGKENAKEVIADLFFALNEIADLLLPFLPNTSKKIKEQLASLQSVSLFPRIDIS